MKLLKLSPVILIAGLAAGCATNSDIENLQGQINTLKTDVSQAKSAANSANTAATDAASKASAAEAAANRAARSAEEVNQKLDRLFASGMKK